MGLATLKTKLHDDHSKEDFKYALKSKESFAERKNINNIISFDY